MTRRITNEFSGIGIHSAIHHLRHLESGFAYDNRCRYCLMSGKGANWPEVESISWYREAQKSNRRQIPIEEYLEVWKL